MAAACSNLSRRSLPVLQMQLLWLAYYHLMHQQRGLAVGKQRMWPGANEKGMRLP